MSQEKCPCCVNHCSKESLSCGRGRDYFYNQSNRPEATAIQEQVIMNLRKCGHSLYCNRDLEGEKILMDFSEEELNILHELLSKIENNMKS